MPPDAGNGTTTDAGDATQSAQASVAADGQQVAPVMSYAPGDGGSTRGR
ncbi:hypothetical protein [Paraburkholderia caballeronis]|nr:hypothetical protein [Paraburkholderia caballeronis]TDV13933.1 hypothetical protein C7408_109103 [Paraburkholderia caballeronis]TDV15446.1 hypothetical protein C7406_110102 [Paraburkholderia caballeronis]TDV24914.1 hypothetical protein C7404_109103 [Paraburkholderia caballeronis]